MKIILERIAEAVLVSCVAIAAIIALFLMLADALWETAAAEFGRFAFHVAKKEIHHGRFARLWESLTG